MKKLPEMLYCSECGSSDVEIRRWVNPNTKEIGDRCSDNSEEDNWCKVCNKHVRLLTLSQLWEELEDIPVNNDDELEVDYMQFTAGTSKFYVWHWFDERCPNNLHDDLLYPKYDAR